jgi:predicted secreted protein
MISLIVSFQACSGVNGSESNDAGGFVTVEEIRDIKPERPVKIKMKRNTYGEYSWELNGDNAERVIETDMKLKKYRIESGSK